MKLRNKKTGIIGELHFEPDKEYHFTVVTEDPADVMIYKKLADLYAEWEDYEEPKEYWYIYGNQVLKNECDSVIEECFKEIGNHFDTREEAEKAVEKLKAWKRLKEANIDYKLSHEYDDFTETMHANVSFSFNSYPLVGKDLDLLFGGKNDK